MTALDELARQCERRGWRVGLAGTYANGRRRLPGLVIDALEIRGRNRELLVSAVADSGHAALEAAAVDCALDLAAKGLID
jgi:hypothetical protein